MRWTNGRQRSQPRTQLLQMLRPPHQVRANPAREVLLARLGNYVTDPVRQEAEFLRLVRPYPQNRPSLSNEGPLAGIGKSVGAQRILCTTASLHIPDNTAPGIHCEVVCEVRISPSGTGQRYHRPALGRAQQIEPR